MLDRFGHTLRLLRKRQYPVLDDFADRLGYSRSLIRKIESGERNCTDQVAQACDDLLGCAPFLQALLSIEKGDPMLRRALLGGTFATAAVLAVDSSAALGQALVYGLDTTGPADWEQTVARFHRHHLLGPAPQFGPEISAQIKLAEHASNTGDTAAGRACAQLALIYGLWLADLGRLPTAHALYNTAAALADKSGDDATRALVAARTANRGPYENWTAEQILTATDKALGLHDTGTPALEAYGARVHVAALTGDITGGRRAVDAMRRTADRMPGEQAQQRAADFACYLECRLGTFAQATRAHESAQKVLARSPLWLADADLAYAAAMVRAGDHTGGAAFALDTIRTQVSPVRVLGVCVADVIHAAGRAGTSDTFDDLRRYATPGPHPWDTV